MATKKANSNSKKTNNNTKKTTKKVVEKEEKVVESKATKKVEKKVVKNPVKPRLTDRTKTIILLIFSLLIIGVAGFFLFRNYQKNSSYMNEFHKVFNSEERKMIFFARTSCAYCQLEKPILKQVVDDYELDYFDIDTDKISKRNKNKIVKELNLSGATPAIVVVEKGKVVATNEGYLEGKELVKFLSDNKVLAENATYKPEENLVDVSFDEFKKIVKEKKYNAILIDTNVCSECITVRSLVSGIAKDNKIKVKYITSGMFKTEKDLNSFVEMFEDMKFDDKEYKETGQINVPLLIITKDNKIVDYLMKNTNKDDYTKLLKKYELIKKNG